jgi:hypothetical protein
VEWSFSTTAFNTAILPVNAVATTIAKTQAELSRLNLKPKFVVLLRLTFVALINKLMGGRFQDHGSSSHFVTSNARTINWNCVEGSGRDLT